MHAVHHTQSQPCVVFKLASQCPTYMRQVNFFFEETDGALSILPRSDLGNRNSDRTLTDFDDTKP